MQPRTAIIGVTGHTNYEEGHEAKQRQISSIINLPVCQNV